MRGLKAANKSACPSRQTLEAILQLPDADPLVVETRDHLIECRDCQTQLDQLTESRHLLDYRATWKRTRHTEPTAETERAGPAPTRPVASVGIPAAVPSGPQRRDERASIGEPRTIGRYSILRELGRGGSGVVYLAFDESIGRKVALKRVAVTNNETRQRLFREARAAANLNVDAIVRLYTIEQTESGEPFITMEFVDGQSVADKIQANGALDPQEAAAVCAAVACGLQAAHAIGILHRDVKPANVLLDQSGQAKLADFGLAHLGELSPDLTATGVIVGTPAYMSPEQAEGKVLDERSDVYGIGCVLYEALSGVPPFRGSSRQILRQIAELEPTPLRRLNDSVPPGLELICSKAMAKRPEHRYSNAEQLRRDLLAWQRGEQLLVKPETTWQRVGRWYRRNPRVAWMATAIAGLLLTITIGSLIAASQISRQSRRAVAASSLAESRAREASQQRALALETLNQLVFTVDKKIQSRPGTLDARKAILKMALDGLRQVTGVTGDEQAAIVDHSTVVAHSRIGMIEMTLGDHESSREHFEIARQLGGRLLSRGDDPIRSREALAEALTGLGDLSLAAFDFAPAETSFRKAVELIEDNFDANQDDVAAHVELGRILYRIGNAVQGLGRFDEARECFQHALQHIEYGSTKVDADSSWLRSQVLVLAALTKLALRDGNTEAALSHLQQWRALNEILLERDPYNTDYLLDAAMGFSQLSQVHSHQRKWSSARDAARHSRSIHERIVAVSLDDAWAKSNLGIQWHVEATCEFALGDYQAAIDAWQQAVALYKVIGGAQADNERFGVLAFEAHGFLAIACLRSGQYPEAINALLEASAAFDSLRKNTVADHDLIRETVRRNQLLLAALRWVEGNEAFSLQPPDLDSEAALFGLALAVWQNSDSISARDVLDRFDQVKGLSAQTPECQAAIDLQWAVNLTRAAEHPELTSPDADTGSATEVSTLKDQLYRRALTCLDRYVCEGGLLVNVQCDPEFRQLRETELYEEWLAQTKIDAVGTIDQQGP